MSAELKTRSWRIRPATAADRDLLVELGRRTFFDTFVGTCADEDMQMFLDESYAPEKVKRELEAERSLFLLLEDEEGEALGYARIFEDPERPEFLPRGRAIELVRFYLRQSAMGSGAAQVLMEACLRTARDWSAEVMYLGVWEKNFRAQRFYEKFGFAKCGEKIFWVGKDGQTDWYLARRL